MKNNYKIEVLSKRICESNIEKILDILKLKYQILIIREKIYWQKIRKREYYMGSGNIV